MDRRTDENLVTLDCEVLRADFEKMVYYYDSGMADMTTKNPAAIALKRSLKSGHQVRVKRNSCNGTYSCIIDGEKFRTSSDLDELFRNAEQGVFLKDFHFKVTLPGDLIKDEE